MYMYVLYYMYMYVLSSIVIHTISVLLYYTIMSFLHSDDIAGTYPVVSYGFPRPSDSPLSFPNSCRCRSCIAHSLAICCASPPPLGLTELLGHPPFTIHC